MFESMEKALLAGIGMLSLTQKKGEEVVEEFRQKFNLSEEKGREMLEALQSAAKENREKLQDLAHEEVKKACDRLGVVTRDEFDKLAKKVQSLEKKLKAHE